MNINWTFFAGAFVIAIIVGVLIGAVNVVMAQRRTPDVPKSVRWTGGVSIPIVFVIAIGFAAPQLITGIGGAAQSMFTGGGARLPDYGNMLNQGGGQSENSGSGQRLEMPGMNNDQRGGGGR